MFKSFLTLSALILLLLGCKKEDVVPVSSQKESFRTYLSTIVDVMQKNAVYRNEIDWIDFRKQVLEFGQNAERPEGTFPAIRLALNLLQDNGHSGFVTRSGVNLTCDCTPDSLLMDNAPVSLDSTIGYVNVPALGDHTQESIKTYITGVQQEIKAADNTAVKGWIVDLRGNTGGYSRPMLQAIRPILGEGIVGYMLSPDGSSYPWDYEQTYSFVDAYKLKRPAPKVAVLMNGTTASAGELIAIAFTGRPQTKSFGTATRGVSTGRAVFDINGEKLSLAINVMADRTMKPYGKKVYPDVEEKNAELVIAKAVQWLNQ